MIKFYRDNETSKTQATMTKYIQVIQNMMWFIDSLEKYHCVRHWPSWGQKVKYFTDIITLLNQSKYLLTATHRLLNKRKEVLLQEKITAHKGKPLCFPVWVWGFFGWGTRWDIELIEFVPKHTQRLYKIEKMQYEIQEVLQFMPRGRLCI